MTRTMALAAATLSVTSLASASALAATELIGFNGTGMCPHFLEVGTLGDGFAEGVRFTVNIKPFIAPGGKVTLSRWNGAYVFQGPVNGVYKTCRGGTANVDLWSNVVYSVRFDGARVIVTLREDSPSMRVDTTSTYNNQAIFKLSEIL